MFLLRLYSRTISFSLQCLCHAICSGALAMTIYVLLLAAYVLLSSHLFWCVGCDYIYFSASSLQSLSHAICCGVFAFTIFTFLVTVCGVASPIQVDAYALLHAA